MRSERLKRHLIVACGVLVGVFAAASSGQDRAGAARGETGKQAQSISAPRAARELARMAALDLQVTNGSNPRDYRVAALLMEVAHEVDPSNETILRLLVDAASSSGDRDTLLRLTKEMVQLNKTDTVAQLRLISGAISSRQDVDGRLKGYEFFLNEYKDAAGNPLDAAIRSRLALDAALLLRERGDLRGFAEKLAQATELDLTNKDAASLAVTFYTEQSNDPVGRLTLLINLLKADPFDPETHLAIGRELAAGDAVTQATRFYQTYGLLLRVRSADMPPNIVAEANTVFWAAEGADKLVQKMRAGVEEQRAQAALALKEAIARDLPVSQYPDPDRVRLTPELERVRLAAALSVGDQGQADYAYGELAKTFELQLNAAQDPTTFPEGTTTQEILDRQRRLRGDLMWMRLWSGKEIPEAEATLKEFKDDPATAGVAEVEPILRRMEGWLLLQKGEMDAAEETLTPLAGSDVLARLGLAVIKERRGQKEEAIKAFESLARDASGSVVGAYSRTQYGVLAGKELERAPVSKELESLGTAVPGWLEDMIADPRRIVSLQATLEPDRIDAMDPAKVRLKLRNVSPIPLAVGPEKPVNSRMLLVPELKAALRQVSATNGAVVVRMDRKLRLLPQEEIEVSVWADQGNMGWIMNRLITAPLSVKWKVIQGFTLLPQGLYVPGPHCMSVETKYIERRASMKAFDEGPGLVKWLETGTSEDIAEVIMLAQINLQVNEEAQGAWPKDQREAIGAALGARFAKLDLPSRVMVAAMLPLLVQAPWLKPAEDAIAADPDPRVQTVALALRVSDPKDPRLAAGQASGDVRLSEMARLVKDRLDDGTKTFATFILEETSKEKSAPGGGKP